MALKEIIESVKKNWKALVLGAAIGLSTYFAGTAAYNEISYRFMPKDKLAPNAVDLRELKNPRFIDLNEDGKLESVINYMGDDYTVEQSVDSYSKKTKIDASQFTYEFKK